MSFAARLAAVTLLLAGTVALAVAQPAPSTYPPPAASGPYQPPPPGPYTPPPGSSYPPPPSGSYSPPPAYQPPPSGSYPPPPPSSYQPPPPAYQPPPPAASAPPPVPPRDDQFSADELIDAGHHFFGGLSRGLALIVQKAGSQWGQPNGYILGEEAGGAFVGGLRYGDGTLYTKNAGDRRVFWQGPTIGFDAGADGARTMMLVYNLPSTEAIFDRFGGIDGSAYFVGGLGMTALTANDIVLVPIRTGVGLRLGANLGYLKFTSRPTWNPF
jgi:hypothetical protein